MSAQVGAAQAVRMRGWKAGVLAVAVFLGGAGPISLPGASYGTAGGADTQGTGAAWAREPRPAGFGQWNGARTIARARLPRQARDTLNSIASGGPYPYAKDGTVFGNFERRLPVRARGYYHEYTVPTPHASNRGARRIVCGGPRRRTDNCFYTSDHYNSFKRIVE